MALRNGDRVRETSTTTGTGTFSLDGAVVSYQTFVAGVGNGNYCHYVIENGTDWEVGIGLVTDATPDTLARTVVLQSSNGDAAVNWGAGGKSVFCSPIAAGQDGSSFRMTPIVRALDAQHSISSVTATEVTGLAIPNLQPGTYVFTYHLIVQSATGTVSPMYGVNFTGTAAVRKMTLRYPGTGTAASTGVADDVVAAPLATGNIYESQPVTAFTTTSPNMGHIAGVAATNSNIYVVIEGIMIVTAAGELEFWHSSETATATSIEAGSSVIVQPTN